MQDIISLSSTAHLAHSHPINISIPMKYELVTAQTLHHNYNSMFMHQYRSLFTYLKLNSYHSENLLQGKQSWKSPQWTSTLQHFSDKALHHLHQIDNFLWLQRRGFVAWFLLLLYTTVHTSITTRSEWMQIPTIYINKCRCQSVGMLVCVSVLHVFNFATMCLFR